MKTEVKGVETGSLLALMSLVLPGYVGLYVSDLVVPSATRTPFQATMWSLFLSLAGAVVAALWVSPNHLAHLFGGAPVTTTALLGTGAQILSSIGVGGGFALITKHVLKNRLGERSAYPTAWDGLWSEHGAERRYIVVEVGHALAIREPKMWHQASSTFLPTGAEWTYFPAEQIRRVDLSRPPYPAKGAQDHEQVQGSTDTGFTPGSGNQSRQVGGNVHQRTTRRLPGAEGASGGDDAEQHHQSEPDRRPSFAARDSSRE